MKDTLHTIGHCPHDADEYAQYLTDSERLAAYASQRFDEEMGLEPDAAIVSRPPDGFRMPSMQAVREHDARLNSGMIPALSTHEDEDEDEQADEESELRQHALDKRRDGMREHSFRLPSQRSRADVRDTLRSMGCAFHD